MLRVTNFMILSKDAGDGNGTSKREERHGKKKEREKIGNDQV